MTDTDSISTLCIQESIFANSVDPDEMQHNAAFHVVLHFVIRSSDQRVHYF